MARLRPERFTRGRRRKAVCGLRRYVETNRSRMNYPSYRERNLPVGSGMYIIHIDMPELGVERILKLGVVSETQYLDRI